MDRETGNIDEEKQSKAKQKHNTICFGHHYTQANTNNINNTSVFLQTTGGIYLILHVILAIDMSEQNINTY